MANKTTDPYKIIKDFQKANPTKEDKKRALKKMSNAEIDRLIKASPNVYAKNFYAAHKKK